MISQVPAIKKRLGACIFLSLLSLFSIIFLLPGSRSSTHSRKIILGNSSWKNRAGWFTWGEPEGKGLEGGVRLVVFGDSWVDSTIEKGEEGKGLSWPQILCKEINCTSHHNFASSQPLSDSSKAPTGAITSNSIYLSSITDPASFNVTLPDLATQIQSFMSLPPSQQPEETIFVISFGLWDIYHLASLPYAESPQIVNAMINEIYTQLDILYMYTYKNIPIPSINESIKSDTTAPKFRVIIPNLFDPTLLPGWQSHRPIPHKPGNVAEDQKNAIYLTARWNSLMENMLGLWMRSQTPVPLHQNEEPIQDQSLSSDGRKEERDDEVVLEKDVFFPPTHYYLVEQIREHSLEVERLADASGLGTGSSPYENVYLPCVGKTQETDTKDLLMLNDEFVCKKPEEYLFWNAWHLGSVAKRGIGEEIAGIVKRGESLAWAWEKEKEAGKGS